MNTFLKKKKVEYFGLSAFLLETAERLQCSVPIERFEFSNTGECSVDHVIRLIQCRVRS